MWTRWSWWTLGHSPDGLLVQTSLLLAAESEPSPPASFSKKRILYVYFGSLGGGGGGQEAAAAAGTGHYIHVCQPGHCQPRCAAMCRYNGSIFHEKRRAWNGLHPLQF